MQNTQDTLPSNTTEIKVSEVFLDHVFEMYAVAAGAQKIAAQRLRISPQAVSSAVLLSDGRKNQTARVLEIRAEVRKVLAERLVCAQ